MNAARWMLAGAIGLAGSLALPAQAQAGDVSVRFGVGSGYCGGRYAPRYYPHNHHHSGYYGYPRSSFIYSEPSVIIERRAPMIVVQDRGYYNRDIVIRVQAELTRRGFYTGGIDGVAGPRTRDAIVAYQMRRGLPVSGVIDRPLLSALHLD